MIEVKELNKLRKALRYLLKRDYSRDEALDIIITALSWPVPDDDSDAARLSRYQAFVDKCKAEKGDDVDVADEAVYRFSRLMEENDVPNMGFNADYSAFMLQLPPICYGEHVVESQRKRIERAGSKLSETGAAHLYERERKRYEQERGDTHSVTSADAIVGSIISASSGRLPQPSVWSGVSDAW